MFTVPVGPVEVFFYWPEAVFGNFYWPGAIGSPLASSPVEGTRRKPAPNPKSLELSHIRLHAQNGIRTQTVMRDS